MLRPSFDPWAEVPLLVHDEVLAVPTALSQYLERTFNPGMIGVNMVKPSVYITDEEVPPHVDNIQFDHAIYLCPLVNTGHYVFGHRSHPDQVWDLTPGRLFRFDARVSHFSAHKRGTVPHLFNARLAFVAWDLHTDYQLGTFAQDLQERFERPVTPEQMLVTLEGF